MEKFLAAVLFNIRLISRECKAVDPKAGAESEMAKRTYFGNLFLFGPSTQV